MSEQEDKLKLIEEDLKQKSAEIDSKEKKLQEKQEEITSQLNIVSKDKLLVTITQAISDIFSMYEASMGTIEGCKELINNTVEAKSKIDIQMKLKNVNG
jgi:vacuolar-type H+-ATPase subunit E/Vma4